jgi:hypothetical protein
VPHRCVAPGGASCAADAIRYLDEPRTVADLQRLVTLLGIDHPHLMKRMGEHVYAELALDDQVIARPRGS